MRVLQRAYGPTRIVRILLLVTTSFIISWSIWHRGGPSDDRNGKKRATASTVLNSFGDTTVRPPRPVSFYGDTTIHTDGSPLALLQKQQRLQQDALEKEADEVCRHQKSHKKWAPWYQTAQGASQIRPRKVYDLCMVNDELDWLEVRLNATYNEVDYFVIVEASKTFTGLDKPLAIRDNWHRFAPYHPKIIYQELVYPSVDYNPARPWDREDLQRDALFGQVLLEDVRAAMGQPVLAGSAAPQWGDVLVVADVDEIPRPETLRALRLCDFPARTTIESDFYYYGFQFRHKGPAWPHPQATTFAGAHGTVWPTHLRNGDGGRGPGNSVFTQLFGRVLRKLELGTISSGGWHCSSCFSTISQLMHKLESVSHVYMNQEYFRQRDRAADYVRRGADLWDREGEEFDRLDNNTDVPSTLLAEPDRFRYLLNRDGQSAGFLDYP